MECLQPNPSTTGLWEMIARAVNFCAACNAFLRRPSSSNVPVQLFRFVPLCQLRRANKSEIADSAVRPRQRFPTLINATRSADSQVGLSRSEHRSSDRVHWLFGLQDYVTLARSIRRDCRANPEKERYLGDLGPRLRTQAKRSDTPELGRQVRPP